ncbi:MAG: serine hydrolase [Mesorhizobium sp.]|nr:MAG: serine hydrolase [Mesorhizobium sp.]
MHHVRDTLGLVLLICANLLFSGFARATEAQCGSAPPKIDDWEVARPDEVSFDASTLCKIGTMLAASDRQNLHSVVVVRRGKLVYEAYTAGSDYKWGTDLGVVTYDATMQHDTRSVSKSVVSLLFGIALDRKLLTGIDMPVLLFFPDYADLKTPQRERILLRHLLTMTAGFAWNEDTAWASDANTERKMYESPDPYRYVLERPVIYDPDERWQYNSGATALLGAVLKKSAGEPLRDFAKDALFDPLQIRDFEWMAMKNGDAIAGGGLRLRPRDMAKIGQLVLNGGEWQGRRIVSETWVKESTKPRFEGWNPMRYAYQWWAGTSKSADRTFDWTAAVGLGGQRIFIVPALDLVVVTTAGLYRDESQSYYVRSILEDNVLTAVRDLAP